MPRSVVSVDPNWPQTSEYFLDMNGPETPTTKRSPEVEDA
jgi:hypothetical protein